VSKPSSQLTPAPKPPQSSAALQLAKTAAPYCPQPFGHSGVSACQDSSDDLDQRDKDALDLMLYGAEPKLSSGKGIPWVNRLGEILQHVLSLLKQDTQTPR